MTSRLTLISHAATAAVRAAAFPLDEGLDAAGKKGAEALAAGLPPFTAALTSPAARAAETAAALGLVAGKEPALRDIDLGAWAGRAFSDVEAADPAAMVQWISDPATAPHGGESLNQLFARVATWLDGIEKQGGRVVAVTHPAVIRAAIVTAIEANPVSFWRIDIAPLTVVELRSNGGRWLLKSISAQLKASAT